MIRLFGKSNKKLLITSLIVVFFLSGILCWQVGLSQAQTNNNTNAQVSVGSAKTGNETAAWLAEALTWITLGFISLAGKITTIFLEQLIGIAGFNQFIDSQAVAIGWVMMRDLSNIFLVVLMLIIALGTLFNIQTYEYKRLLPKLVLAAILINFSKTIVGLMIDFGQVIMMQFVNAFKDLGAGSVVNALGIHSMLQLSDVLESQGGDILRWNIFGATFLALIMLIIAALVILALIVILLFRVLMLWLLIIFSPLAFVFGAISGGPLKSISFIGNYWNNLIKYIAIGPIIAFLLWLSFNIMAVKDEQNKQHIINLYRSKEYAEGVPGQVEYLASKISSPQNMFDYMVGIALLLGALMVAQQAGVMAGAMGMNMVNKVQGKIKRKAADWSRASTIGVTKKAALKGGRAFDRSFVEWQKKKGVEKPVSLRPTVRKKVKEELEKKRDEEVYERLGIVGGMVERKLGHDKFKLAEQQQEAFEAKRMKELVRGDEYDDPGYQISRAKKIIAAGGPKNDDERLELKALFEMLAKGGDLSKLLKETGRSTDRQGLKELTTQTFGPGEEASKVANRLEKIAVAKGEIQYNGTTQIDLDTGKAKFTDLENKDNQNAYLQTRFAGYVAQAKSKKPTQWTDTDKEFLRVYHKAGGDLTQLSGQAREIMIDEKQAQAVAKLIAGKAAAEQAVLMKPELGLGAVGKRAFAVGSHGILKREDKVRGKTINFLKDSVTLQELENYLNDPFNGLSQEEKDNLKKLIKKYKQQAHSSTQQSSGPSKGPGGGSGPQQRGGPSGSSGGPSGSSGGGGRSQQQAQSGQAQQNQAWQQAYQTAQQEINQLDRNSFERPDEIAQVSNELQAAIDEAVKQINEIEVNPNVNIDLSKINQNIEEVMKRIQKSIDKNIKPNQPKPNLSFISQQMKGQTDIKSQKAFLKQLKSLVSGLSQIVSGGKGEA